MTAAPESFDPDRLRDLIEMVVDHRGGWDGVTDADLRDVQRSLLTEPALRPVATTPGDDRSRELATARAMLGEFIDEVTRLGVPDIARAWLVGHDCSISLAVLRALAAPAETERYRHSPDRDALHDLIHEASDTVAGGQIAPATADAIALAVLTRYGAPAETEAGAQPEGMCQECRGWVPLVLDLHRSDVEDPCGGSEGVPACGARTDPGQVLCTKPIGHDSGIHAPATPPAPEGEAVGPCNQCGYRGVIVACPDDIGPTCARCSDEAASPSAPGEGQGATEGGDEWPEHPPGSLDERVRLVAADPDLATWQRNVLADVRTVLRRREQSPAPAGPPAEGADETAADALTSAPGLWWSPTAGLIRGFGNGGHDDAIPLTPACGGSPS